MINNKMTNNTLAQTQTELISQIKENLKVVKETEKKNRQVKQLLKVLLSK
jgi:hypothetical protein